MGYNNNIILLISPETDLYQSLPLLSEVGRLRFIILDVAELRHQPTGQFLHRGQRAMETFLFLMTEEVEVPGENISFIEKRPGVDAAVT